MLIILGNIDLWSMGIRVYSLIQMFRAKPIKFNSVEEQIMDSKIQEMLQKGIIKQAPLAGGGSEYISGLKKMGHIEWF